MKYPILSDEQINLIKNLLIPEFNEEGITNLASLKDAEADGLEWLEMFEDSGINDLAHISNKELGLKEDAEQDERDKVFEDIINQSPGEMVMAHILIWDWLEEDNW